MDLAGAIARHPELRTAWSEGRFLRDLERLAAAGATIEEAAMALEIGPEILSRRLSTDPAVWETWHRARLETTLRLKRALLDEASKGKARAIAVIETSLRSAITRKAADIGAMSMRQLAGIIGKSHQTLYNWKERDGMPTNCDGTVDLSAFLGWFEKFVAARATGQAADARPEDPLRAINARTKQFAFQKEIGQYIPREQFVAALAGRAQALRNALQDLPGRLARACHAQSAAQIERIVTDHLAGVRRAACEIPESLRCDPRQTVRLGRLLRVLAGEERE